MINEIILAIATKLILGTIATTFFKLRASIDIIKAEGPLLQETTYFDPKIFANFFSKFLHKLPLVIISFFNDDLILFISIPLIFCNP